MSERIHFGSLEKDIAAKRAKDAEAKNNEAKGNAGEKEVETPKSSDAIEVAVKAGNINIHQEQMTEVMDLSEKSKEAQEQHAALLKKVEAEARARTIIVPTKPEDVALKLRELGQPVRLFSENREDVRERLKRFLAAREMEDEETEKVQGMVAPKPSFIPRKMQMTEDTSKAATATAAGSAAPTRKGADVVYTPASDALLEARASIAVMSFARARSRLVGAKRRRGVPEETAAVETRTAETLTTMKHLAINSSQFGDTRPLTAVKISPDGGAVATGSWTCLIKLWDMKNLDNLKVLRGHEERVTGLAWHPEAYSGRKTLLASGAADRTARIWDCEEGTCVQILRGHEGRLARIDYHPGGQYVGTASFDHTWRLWDVETGEELLLQDGHHSEVYGISFQKDGALVATGDLGGTGRIWDLRSGKNIWVMQGHVKRITGMDFSPCGYEVASGSDDHSARIWDIRKQQCIYCLPAHSALVSDVRYSDTSGEVLVTTSFDNSAKVWSTRDWSLLRTLSGHEGKVTGCDITPDERKVVTCSFDRTVKVWAHHDEF